MRAVPVLEAIGPALDHMVALALGAKLESQSGGMTWLVNGAMIGYQRSYNPSTDWEQGGPIIFLMKDYCQEANQEEEPERQYYCSTPSVAADWHNHPVCARGSTPLIAAMRCYVLSKLGDTVEIPEELTA